MENNVVLDNSWKIYLHDLMHDVKERDWKSRRIRWRLAHEILGDVFVIKKNKRCIKLYICYTMNTNTIFDTV